MHTFITFPATFLHDSHTKNGLFTTLALELCSGAHSMPSKSSDALTRLPRRLRNISRIACGPPVTSCRVAPSTMEIKYKGSSPDCLPQTGPLSCCQVDASCHAYHLDGPW